MYFRKTSGSRVLSLVAIVALLGWAGVMGNVAFAAGPAPQSHQHLDGRFSHNQLYFDHGYSVRRPPPGGVGVLRGRDGYGYWYHGGNWYRHDGRAWIVGGAPLGLYVPFLPPLYTTIWWYGVPYYYANDTYYTWDDGREEYEVVEPPDGVESGASTRPPASNRLFVYPKKGQSPDQQKQDEYECHRSAVEQSGYDPTVSGGGVPVEQAVSKRDDYFRARVACLEAREYVVK